MDCSNEDDNELSEWKGDDYYMQNDSGLGTSNCLWDVVNQTEDDFSYMFKEATPIKSCEDLPYNIADHGRSMKKPVVDYIKSYTQVKRRRMLQFDSHIDDPRLCNEATSLPFIKSKDRMEAMEGVLPEKQNLGSRYSEDRSVSCNESLDPPSDKWLSNCFNDGAIHFNSDNMSLGVAEDQLNVSECCNFQPEMQVNTVQQCPTPPLLRVFKGRKSNMITPTKLASSIAYPFALIKPCGVEGDVTLKDINQRILTPPSSKSSKDETSPYPTSAFSGKPVVVKTKIRTEGGKGSITIMRTKG